MASELASYKVQFRERRARVVPRFGPSGGAFAGPGVDLLGEHFDALVALTTPMRAWVDAREPGLTLRSMSVDLRTLRILLTVDPPTPNERARPLAFRIEPPASLELCEALAELEQDLTQRAKVVLANRR